MVELDIGFLPKKQNIDEDGVRIIEEVDLIEISLINTKGNTGGTKCSEI